MRSTRGHGPGDGWDARAGSSAARPSTSPRYGYVEEEFFLDGTATRYRMVGGAEPARDGRWDVEPASEAPYRTRIVVLRPDDPATFNGTVLVCWNNVTAGYDGFSGDNAEILAGRLRARRGDVPEGRRPRLRRRAAPGPTAWDPGALRVDLDPE